MKAIDTSEPTIGMSQVIVDKGYKAVGVYLRPDRCSAAMIAELHHVGLKIWSIYEKGHPTHDSYFSKQQGNIDGHAAASFAKLTLAQPVRSLIYACVDYDPDEAFIRSGIVDYMTAFRSAIGSSGYDTGVYGSGRTCRILIEAGLVTAGWLCVSRDFAERQAFLPHAAIVQTKVVNSNWDANDIQDPTLAGLWPVP